ncbi:MAG: hypothetical protein H6648_02835 [Caldilineae bacterium]|nr:hypothetical protein [Chloroflexota bacterium]MCB9176068.1 hypothetical protein [Caldilineae bacterium]
MCDRRLLILLAASIGLVGFVPRWNPPAASAARIATGGFARQAPMQATAEPSAAPTDDATPEPSKTPIPVGGRVDGKNACYVRLPDLPANHGLYAGFGAYNWETGVLSYAGGASKLNETTTTAYFDLYAIRLDGEAAAWKSIGYASGVGYTRESGKGCRDMASVALGPSSWLSVFGRDGCDNGRFDNGMFSGGDIKELQLGATADRAGVRWTAGSGVRDLIGVLLEQEGKLRRAFGVYDDRRKRVVFGQGTFDNDVAAGSQDKVYTARKAGSQFQLSELRPAGRAPAPRYGSCAAYVGDASAGLDGVLVLGGEEGGLSGSLTYDEVWWLDFSGRADGEWFDISDRFENRADFGPRREGACAYDPETRFFYSWMGRSSKDIPGGAKNSSGAWRVNLAELGGSAPLTWERLAKDDLKGVRGRSLIPSVWDPVNKRMFALGGRNGQEAFTEVWAIYPDVSDEACDALDPYAPFRSSPRPTPSPSPSPEATASPAPSLTPSPTATEAATPAPTATASPSPTDTATARPSATPQTLWRAYLPVLLPLEVLAP